MSIQRYTIVETTDQELARYVPSGATVSARGTQYIDINLTDDNDLEALTEYIQFLGGLYVEAAPTTNTATSANPTGYAQGCTTSVVSTSEIGIATGTARAVSDDWDIVVTGVLIADVGVLGANGRDAGVGAVANSLYAVYVIDDSTGIEEPASLLSLSFATPALPTGYDRFRRIGCARTDGGADFMPMRQEWGFGVRRYYYDATPATTEVLSAGAAAAFTDVAVGAFVPPTATHAILLASFSPTILGALTDELNLRPDGSTVDPPLWRMRAALGATSFGQFEIPCPGQIVEYRVTSAANNTADLSVVGFDDVL